MREINSQLITEKIEEMCINANCNLNCDILDKIITSIETENSKPAREILNSLLENSGISERK